MCFRNCNHIITEFLTSLNEQYKNPLVQDLIVGILAACPDQLKWYLPSLHNFSVPRPTPNWKILMQFLQKVYAVLNW